MMTETLAFMLMAVSFVVTMAVYPLVLSFARKHHIVDNPNARKLQRVPVPVMGGTTVYIGMIVAVVVGMIAAPGQSPLIVLALLTVMYLTGVWDDLTDVSPFLRFLIEIIVVWLIILMLDMEINDFHGLWGIHGVPDVVSVPLSVVAGVGIMNAVNLIDGVDGYCSSYGIMTCIVFAVIFYYAGDMTMFTFALIVIGALVPFFFHNVFGKTSKMFLGDGGSLLLGTVLSLFTFSALSSNSACADYGDEGLSLVALTLSILAVPVFDTLRVMVVRVLKGNSPFHPDKTHLHHLFIEMNFSHLATSFIIVSVNAIIVLILLLCWRLGASINVQVYVVIALALLFTWAFYFFMEREHRKNDGDGSALFQRWCRHGRKTNITAAPVWRFIRKVVDSKLLGGASETAPGKTPTSEPSKRIDPRIQ